MVCIIAYLVGMENYLYIRFVSVFDLFQKFDILSAFNIELVRSTQNQNILKTRLTKLTQNQNQNRAEVLRDVHA